MVSEDERFEVIVCDDASSDNAQELLSQIHDPRFRYVRNTANLGAHKNWLKSLELGRGEWLYFVIGRDKVNGEHITRLIEILEWARGNGITLLYEGYSNKTEPVIYSGIDAMSYFLDVSHPTGTIFRRSIFAKIPCREYYFTHSDMYPENYVRRDMLLKGSGASIMSGVYKQGLYSPLINRAKIQSTVESGKNIYDMYYAPRRKAVHYHEIIDMIDDTEPRTFSQPEKDKFFGQKFRSLLNEVSFRWWSNCRDAVWQAHYGQKVKRVSVCEMVRNILTAYRDTKAHLDEKGTLTPARLKIMRRCVPVMIVYAPMKCFAKAVLVPLGFWEFAKRMILRK